MALGLAYRQPRTLAFAVLVASVVLYPLLFGSSYGIGAGITVGAMAVSTVGFVLLIGYAHQLALGQAAFCMIGGYGNAVLVTKYGWDPLLAMIVSMIAAMALAYLIGKPILKLRGFVLAMASLALQLVLVFVSLEAVSVTEGAMGVSGVPKFAVLGWPLADDRVYFYFVWLLVILAVAIGLNVDRSRIGRALKAIASSEAAAGSVGIDITKYKVQMFVLSAGMASVTGSLLVHYLRIMEPHVFGFQFSLNIITAVIAGGLTSIWGGVLGAGIIIALREALRVLALPLLEGVVMGALTVLVLILFPRGVAGGIAGLYARLVGPERSPEAAAARAVRPQPSAAGADVAPLGPRPGPSAAPGGTLLSVDGARRAFGNLIAVNNVSFAVPAGSITALIGPNGAGKTTMFNLISGYQPLDAGEVVFEGRRIGTLLPHAIARQRVGRTFQNLQLFDNMTAIENVMCGRYLAGSAGLAEIAVRLPHVSREEQAIRAAAERSLAFVGLADAADRPPTTLPFGHQRLLEIARALAVEPRLLLMDEPASGLNDTETERLADLILRIRAGGTTVLLVEHDIRLVMGLADHVVVMNYGEKIAEGPADVVRADPQVVAAYLGA
ncbi:MAG TPA: branched-chain amino acid ABC transporter ATP-binding protein/permease [Alphaproteobacteria bacterium]|jgi:branched-chain amino acid transport system permease protein|nr:branched-chain amino acid ABC transporter ATP-binding protein/permease [Alphaproteobacteria bacterium]